MLRGRQWPRAFVFWRSALTDFATRGGARARLPACIALCLLGHAAMAADEDAFAAVRTSAGRTMFAPASEEGDARPPAIKSLDAIQVTGARESDGHRQPDPPSAAFTVDRQAMDRINLASSEDALKYAPNLHVRKRFAGDNNSVVSVRSTSTRQSARTLVYADGQLLSNLLGSDFTFAPRWSMVMPDSLESVQVLYGPFSARYPGNSLGATILMTTRMPERLEGGGSAQLSGQRHDAYGHGTSADGRRYAAWLGDRTGAWSWRLALERMEAESQPASYFSALQSDTAAGAGDTAVTGAVAYRDQFDRPAYLMGINSEGMADTVGDQVAFKLAYDIAPEWQAAFSVTDWRQQQDKRTGSWLRDGEGNVVDSGPIAIGGWRYTLPGNAFAPGRADSERRLYGASLRSDRAYGWNLSLVASRLDTPKDIARTSGTAGEGAGQLTDGRGSGWDTLDVQADYLAGPGPGAAHTLSLGAHVDRYTLDSRTFATGDWRYGPPAALISAFAGKTRTQAAYLEDSWRFAPDWSLTGGLRYERWSAFDGSRQTASQQLGYARRDDGYWSPKLSLAHALEGGWTARLSLAEAYRMPTVSELFQGSISGTAIIDNDPDLKPERALSRDLTFERLATGHSLRLSLYEDDVRDTLFSQTDTTVFPTVISVQNVDRVRTRGIEVAGQGRDVGWEGLDLSASVAWNRARTLENHRNPASEGRRFYRIPDWRADVSASYRFNPVYTVTLAGRYSGRQYNSLDNTDTHPDTFGGTSRYLVFDARLEAALGPQWRLAAGIDNLTGERYYVYHPYPGRTWSLEARYRF